MTLEMQNSVSLSLIDRITSQGRCTQGFIYDTIQLIVKADLNLIGHVEEINNRVEELFFVNGTQGVKHLDWFNARCINTILNS